MGSSPVLVVPNDGIRGQAERLLAGPPSRRALVLGFGGSTASSVEVLVEGASFYPRMLADIAAASSSVHINQFGFRPGLVGDRFADALIGKVAEGVSVGSSSTGKVPTRSGARRRSTTASQPRGSRFASCARRGLASPPDLWRTTARPVGT
jgi:phosphatidylserine/phosphatidylglycerophosphate/cardiolipin synthase-like enzyme